MLARLEKQATIITGGAFLLFLITIVIHRDLNLVFTKDNYLSLHIILEFFSIAISFAITMQGWHSYKNTNSMRELVLSAAFFVVGTFDLVHTLSYKGMPMFITPSSVQKATWFWVIARLSEAILLAMIYLRKFSKLSTIWIKWLYPSAIVYVFTVCLLIIERVEWLPLLVIEGEGVTGLKVALEYLIGVLHAITAIGLLFHYKSDKQPHWLTLIVALIFILLGELFFTLYRDVYGLENLLGHIYKLFGYFFILKGIYIPSVQEPFLREQQALTRLHAKEEELNKFFEYSLDILCIMDLHGCFKRINPSITRVLGYAEAELLGKAWHDFIQPEDRIQELESLEQFEGRFITKAGVTKWIEWQFVPDYAHKLCYAIARDVTERKLMEQILRESQERFKNAFYYTGIGMALFSLERKIIDANQALARILGYGVHELLTMSIDDITAADDIDISTKQCTALRKGEVSSFQVEKRYVVKGGALRWVAVSVSLVRDNADNPLYYIAQIQDIHERKLDQAKLTRMAAIVESSEDAIFAMSLDGTINSWNRGAQLIYGYTEAEIIGRSIEVLVPTDRKHEFSEKIIGYIKNGERIKHFETRRLNKFGKLVDVSKTISPIYDGKGQLVGISVIARDITQRKKMEQEMVRLDRLNAIGEMAAGISHEVRNPMTTVKGFLQLLNEKTQDETQKGYFQLMIDELDRANGILSEFLSIGRNRPSEVSKQSLNEIILALTPLIKAEALKQDKHLVTELSELPNLQVNDKEIRQLILNLARNGLEAMEAGGTVTIYTYLEQNEVVLSIKDEGSGIDPVFLEKIGTPFFSTKASGTGLGLSICYSIAARHQAVINVETGNTGTTFFVRFKI